MYCIYMLYVLFQMFFILGVLGFMLLEKVEVLILLEVRPWSEAAFNSCVVFASFVVFCIYSIRTVLILKNEAPEFHNFCISWIHSL